MSTDDTPDADDGAPVPARNGADIGLTYRRIGPFRDLLDANLAKAKLVDLGIGACLDGEHLSAMLGPVYGAAYGGLYLLVRADEEAAAHAVVRDVERLRRERTDAESPACPRCGAHAGRQVISPLRWAAGSIVTVGIAVVSADPFPGYGMILVGTLLLIWPQLPAWKCRACGRRHHAPVPEPAEGA
jgi:hypothetical protein